MRTTVQVQGESFRHVNTSQTELSGPTWSHDIIRVVSWRSKRQQFQLLCLLKSVQSRRKDLWPRAQLFVIRSRTFREILGPQYSVTTIHNQDPTYMLARLTQLALPFLSHTKVDPSQFRASMSTSERQS